MNWFPFLKRRKKPAVFGLALGSGGAKGMAHLGALKAFEEASITFDVIAGASIGSIVGATYAAGYSAGDVFRMAKNLDLKEAATAVLLRADGLTYVVSRFLDGLDDFSELRKPFAAVATDLKTGEPVVVTEGKLAESLAASSAMPPYFRPVMIGDRVCIDGAFSSSVPSDVCRTMGANFVVAIDLATYSASVSQNQKPLLDQLFPGNGVDPSKARSRGRQAADIVIDPVLTGYHATDFGKMEQMFEIGYEAASRVIPEILAAKKRLS